MFSVSIDIVDIVLDLQCILYMLLDFFKLCIGEIINKGRNGGICMYGKKHIVKITASACINGMVKHHYHIFHLPHRFFLQTIDRHQILPGVMYM